MVILISFTRIETNLSPNQLTHQRAESTFVFRPPPLLSSLKCNRNSNRYEQKQSDSIGSLLPLSPPLPSACRGESRRGAAQSGTRSSFILGIQLSDGATSGIVFSKESSRVEATLDCRLFAVPGRAHYIPRLGFSLQDGRTPRSSGIHAAPLPLHLNRRAGRGKG